MPLTLQITPISELPVTTAEYCAEVPRVTVVGPLSASVTGGSPPPVPCGGASVTLRLFETAGSTTLVALIVTFDEDGSAAGAVYFPLLDTVPILELPPVTPLTLQTTEVFELPVTVAEY
jgi:hypothetical protein